MVVGEKVQKWLKKCRVHLKGNFQLLPSNEIPYDDHFKSVRGRGCLCFTFTFKNI